MFHRFVYEGEDGEDPTEVQPLRDWNDHHSVYVARWETPSWTADGDPVSIGSGGIFRLHYVRIPLATQDPIGPVAGSVYVARLEAWYSIQIGTDPTIPSGPWNFELPTDPTDDGTFGTGVGWITLDGDPYPGFTVPTGTNTFAVLSPDGQRWRTDNVGAEMTADTDVIRIHWTGWALEDEET